MRIRLLYWWAAMQSKYEKFSASVQMHFVLHKDLIGLAGRLAGNFSCILYPHFAAAVYQLLSWFTHRFPVSWPYWPHFSQALLSLKDSSCILWKVEHIYCSDDYLFLLVPNLHRCSIIAFCSQPSFVSSMRRGDEEELAHYHYVPGCFLCCTTNTGELQSNMQCVTSQDISCWHRKYSFEIRWRFLRSSAASCIVRQGNTLLALLPPKIVCISLLLTWKRKVKKNTYRAWTNEIPQVQQVYGFRKQQLFQQTITLTLLAVQKDSPITHTVFLS